MPELDTTLAASAYESGRVAGAIFVAGAQARKDYDPAKVRAEMLAGCEDTADAESRPFCGCLVDEILARNGTTPDDLARLSDEIRAVENDGAPLPAVYGQAGEACARKAGLIS